MQLNNLHGSICLTDLSDFIRANPSLKQRAKNGKDYLNINIYFKKSPDQYGNVASIALKNLDKNEPTKYLGNLKEFTPAVVPTENNDSSNEIKDDLPF